MRSLLKLIFGHDSYDTLEQSNFDNFEDIKYNHTDKHTRIHTQKRHSLLDTRTHKHTTIYSTTQ